LKAEDVIASPGFRRSLVIQRRVIGALLMREVISRFGRSNIGVLWLFGEPMIFTLGITTLWTFAHIVHRSGAIPIVAFAVTGYSSVLMWRNSVGHCCGAIQHNINLLYHRNVQVVDVLITRILLEIAGATASFTILSCFFIAIGWLAPPVDLALVLAGWLMLAWFGVSLALTIGSLTAYSHLVERLWHPMAYLLFPMSGAAFMVDWLPRGMQQIVQYLPMVHGVELLRKGYFGNAVRTHFDIGYMAICCTVLTFAGLLLARDVSRRVEVE
jgi:capsular polysaccharide transport system permease protein